MITFGISTAPQGATPGRDVSAGGGFGEMLATLTAGDAETAALADPGEGGEAPAGDEAGADETGADEALLVAAAERLADADGATRADELVASRLGATLADLGGRPGLQRRELLAALATAGLADAPTEATGTDAADGDAGDALAQVADGETLGEDELAVLAGAAEEATPAVLRALAAAVDAATEEAAAADGAAASDGSGDGGEGEADGTGAAGSAARAAVAGNAAGTAADGVAPGAAATGAARVTGEAEASLEGADAAPPPPDVDAVGDESGATHESGASDEGEGASVPDAGRASARPVTTSGATLTDGAEVGGGTTISAPDGPMSSSGTEASARPAGSSIFVDRALEAAARLEHLAPPRQLTVELGEVRLRMALEDGVLRVQLLGDGAESGDERLLEDIQDELRARGFDLEDEHAGGNAGDGDRGADPRGEHAPAGGPSARAHGRATTTTPHVPSRPTGLRL